MRNDQNEEDRPESSGTDCRRIEGDLPAFALGCLDSADSDRIARHLPICRGCRALLRSYEQTAGQLAFGVPQVAPPDSLKARLMDRIGEQPTDPPAIRADWRRSFLSLFRGFSPALAAAVLVLFVSLSTVSLLQWRQSRTISRQLSEPMKIFKMRGTERAPHADGTFVIGQNHTHGVIVASDLPAIQPGHQFQLWLIRNGQKESGGTFSTSPQGYGVMVVSAPRPLSEYQTAKVTIEPLGGSPYPTGPELMTARLNLNVQ